MKVNLPKKPLDCIYNNIHQLISAEEIKMGVARLAKEINIDYNGKNPLFLGILKGGFIFLADLVRNLNINLEIEFIGLSSYGQNVLSTGIVEVTKDITDLIKGRHVIIVEDIIDTGVTLSFLIDYLKNHQPASVKLCALISKPERREIDIQIDYIGFEIPNRFIVGYGCDYQENFRHLPFIGYMEPEPKCEQEEQNTQKTTNNKS